MSQQIGGYPPSTTTGDPAGPPTTQVARDEAADVGRTATDAGRHVAGTAADQAANVAQEVKAQARDLVGEARGQVQHQARTGQQKAAEGIRSLSSELREMADGGQQSGPVSEVARQAAQRADRLADWLGEREPMDLLDEVRLFARRRPGAFLLGAAVAGVVVGRLTRGAVDSARRDSGPQRLAGSAYPTPHARPVYTGSPGTGLPPAGLPPVAPGPYDAPTPPQGYVAPRPYAPTPTVAPVAGPPTSAPLPPAPPASGLDPYDPAVGPRTSGVPGDYVDEVERGAHERRGTADENFDDPFRPGDGSLR
jgi:hypothetical protein